MLRSLRTGSASVIGLVAAVLALLLLNPAAASATWTSYFEGASYQNETHSSPTTSMNGGQTYPGVDFVVGRVTISGLASYEGTGYVSTTFTSRTTYQYCQWRYVGTLNPVYLTCAYQH
jgi:hypothetical protein